MEAEMQTTFRTRLHGRSIELPWELGLPEGHEIEVTIRTCPEVESPREPPPPRWLERLEVNPAVLPGKLVIKGTAVRADALVALVEEGRSDEDLLRAHPEVTTEDISAVREYAKVPLGLRQSFGAWAEDAEELDQFIEETYRLRRAGRREVAE
jgi:uncharacterized protein (DUF433 family)